MAFPTTRIVALAAALTCSMAVCAAPAWAAPDDVGQGMGASENDGPAKRFACQDGGAIVARFATERGRLVAIVDAFDGDGPHTLASRPYHGPPVELIWSDGRRTLSWSPGVQIMWMDDSVHRMCGGGHHH